MLLNQREDKIGVGIDNITEDDMDAYEPRRWRRIEALSDQFWKAELKILKLREKLNTSVVWSANISVVTESR